MNNSLRNKINITVLGIEIIPSTSGSQSLIQNPSRETSNQLYFRNNTKTLFLLSPLFYYSCRVELSKSCMTCDGVIAFMAWIGCGIVYCMFLCVC